MKKLFFVVSLSILLKNCSPSDSSNTSQIPDTLPDVSLITFSTPTEITNPYYGPGAGQTYIYSGNEIGGSAEEEIIIQRRTTTKDVMGITCIIHHDIVYLDTILIEDTDDWLAQDDEGNLWYLGEFVKNYDEVTGNFLDNDGSWEAGIDGALPGYWLPVSPTVGQHYHQEYYAGEAEDEAEVVSVDETVTTTMGTFTNCLVTKDFTRFEANVIEYKYYAPNIGLIKEEKFEEGELVEVLELVEIIE
jgi:hypothetical protein